MNALLRLTLLLVFPLAGCVSNRLSSDGLSVPRGWGQQRDQLVVKATAYTHTEADSLKYGKLTASGGKLRSSGSPRSAAADWSILPMGTRFQIAGLRETFEVDDYGSALVGKPVVDIYHPSRKHMNLWGAPMVGIRIVRWGSFDESLRILEPRERHARHVRIMAHSIRTRHVPSQQPQEVPMVPRIIGPPPTQPAIVAHRLTPVSRASAESPEREPNLDAVEEEILADMDETLSSDAGGAQSEEEPDATTADAPRKSLFRRILLPGSLVPGDTDSEPLDGE